jgi:hypothetical protein
MTDANITQDPLVRRAKKNKKHLKYPYFALAQEKQNILLAQKIFLLNILLVWISLTRNYQRSKEQFFGIVHVISEKNTIKIQLIRILNFKSKEMSKLLSAQKIHTWYRTI